jgi:hypothetical protein
MYACYAGSIASLLHHTARHLPSAVWTRCVVYTLFDRIYCTNPKSNELTERLSHEAKAPKAKGPARRETSRKTTTRSTRFRFLFFCELQSTIASSIARPMARPRSVRVGPFLLLRACRTVSRMAVWGMGSVRLSFESTSLGFTLYVYVFPSTAPVLISVSASKKCIRHTMYDVVYGP